MKAIMLSAIVVCLLIAAQSAMAKSEYQLGLDRGLFDFKSDKPFTIDPYTNYLKVGHKSFR